jgi:hypothetical protein
MGADTEAPVDNPSETRKDSYTKARKSKVKEDQEGISWTSQVEHNAEH